MIKYRDLLSDTICSPITPPGYSGVAVIRVSGEQAFAVTKKLIENKSLEFDTHKSYLTSVLDKSDKKIDQVLLTTFKHGQSFTGDETVEVSCHGNPLLVNAITKRYLEEGCRSAEKGEFSFRAYYNGKIDLVQAESIQQLVTAKIKKGSETFVDQLQGQLSKEFKEIQEQLVLAMAHLEATIDFVEQDLDVEDFTAVEKIVNNINIHAQTLLKSYDVGKSLATDFKILLLGQTNAGKSSLFNKFVKAERAIVTEIEGTTRDIVTEQQFVGNSSVKFLDSAGLRQTSDEVESIGIQKSLESAESADLILFVIDSSNPESVETLASLPQEKVHIVFNKIDLLSSVEPDQMIKQILNPLHGNWQRSQMSFVSSLTEVGISDLIESIENKISEPGHDDESSIITQARHFNHLTELSNYLLAALKLLKEGGSPDLISQELILGLSEVHQLLGKEYDDEVLDKIFSEFCIGK